MESVCTLHCGSGRCWRDFPTDKRDSPPRCPRAENPLRRASTAPPLPVADAKGNKQLFSLAGGACLLKAPAQERKHDLGLPAWEHDLSGAWTCVAGGVSEQCCARGDVLCRPRLETPRRVGSAVQTD